MRLGRRNKYPTGGKINAEYPDLNSILHPVRRYKSDRHLYDPRKTYEPGRNAASGAVSNEITDNIIMSLLPLPPMIAGAKALSKGYKALKATGKAEQLAAEVAAKQVELDAQAAASQLATQTLKGRQPLVTKRQLSSYDDPTRPHTSIPAAIKGMDRGSDYKDIYHGEDLLGKERENTVRELITQELKNNPKSFVKDLGRPDLANLPDDKIRNIINVNDEVRRHLKDIYYKDTRQPLKGIDAYQQLTVNKHGGKLKKRNYTPSNMEAFHQANDAHLTSGPFLQRNGMSFQNGGKPTNVNYTDPQSFLTANGAYLDSLNYYNAARDFSSKFDALNPNHDEAGTNRKIEWLKTPEGQRLDSTMDAAAGRLFERNLPRGIYSPPMPTSPKTKPVFIPPNKRFPQGGTIAPYVTKDPNDPRIRAYRDSSSLALKSYRETENSKKFFRSEINTMDSLLENRLSPLEKATLFGIQSPNGRFSYKPEYSQSFIPASELKADMKTGNGSKMGAAYVTGKAALKGNGYKDAINYYGYGAERTNQPTGYNVIGDDRYTNMQYINKSKVKEIVADGRIPEKYRNYIKNAAEENKSEHFTNVVPVSVKDYLNKDTGEKTFPLRYDDLYNVVPKYEFPKQKVILQKDQVPTQLAPQQPTKKPVSTPKKVVTKQVQTPQEMPKDTVRVPNTPPTKRVVQTYYRDARPYYQEEQMRDYEKTGKLDSSKIDAHKRFLKEQGHPNQDTNLLPYKHAYGGNMSSLGQGYDYDNTQGKQQSANAIQGTAEKIPVYGQFAAIGKQFSEAGADMVGRDTNLGKGITRGRPDQALAQLGQDFKSKNYLSATANLMTGGSSEFFKPVFGIGMAKERSMKNQALGIANSEGFQDSGFMANGGLLNTDPSGRVVTSRYDQGGNIRRVQGGVMQDEGFGVEHAYGASHEQGGMDYSDNAEIQGGEKVIDGEYVLTNEPGSNLDKTQMSISRRFNKDTKALSKRNSTESMQLATEKLKQHAMQKNDEYLSVRDAERTNKLRNAIRRAVKKYGGDLETLDAEMQMRSGGNISSRGSKWILEDGTGRRKLSDYGADPSVFAADYMSGNAYDAQRAGLNPSSSAAYSGAPMANYGQKMFANNDAYSGYKGYDGLPGYGSMADTPPNVNTNNTGNTYGRWESDRTSTPPPSNNKGNWKSYANTAADLAPVIANTIAGLSKADKVKASKYYTKYMNPDLMGKDFEPIRRGIAGSQYGLRNSGMYSRAGQSSIAAQGAKAMGDYSFNVDQANTGIKNQFKGLNSQIETGNRGIDWQSDMFNFQAKDARRNYLMQAAGDLSKYSQNKQNYNRDQEFLEMAYPEYARIMRSKRGK